MSYTAVVLDKASVINLTKEVKENIDVKQYNFHTKQNEPLPHHMTLYMGKPKSELVIGKLVTLYVDAIFLDEEKGVCAARVTDCITLNSSKIKSENKHPHITICLKDGIKPYESNNIDWSKPTYEVNLNLYGHIMECH